MVHIPKVCPFFTLCTTARFKLLLGMDPLQVQRQFPPDVMYSGDPRVQQDLYMIPHLDQQPGSHTGVARGWEPPSSSSASRTGNYTHASYVPLPSLPSRHSTEPDDDDEDDDGGEYLPGPSRRAPKRPRVAKPAEQGVSVRPKGVKKTLIACDFCRGNQTLFHGFPALTILAGRKLRCDGTRPSCWNCKARENQVCVYQAQPRRRGPGKAPKGQKKKKPSATASVSDSRASNEGSQYYSTSGDDYDLAAELRQQHSLPPILPYYPPSLPQGGLILPSSRMPLESDQPPQAEIQDDQDRSATRYPRRGTIKREDDSDDNARR